MATSLWVRTIRHHRTDRQATVPCRREEAHSALLEACHELDLPDLILIDGGPQQLRFARQAILDLGMEPPAMFGLAERLEEIWLPEATEPILLDHRTPELQLVQRVRDEAHRFGIIHHRTLRQKAALHSKLEEIPGIGPARRKELLKAFGSLKAIREADTEALTRVKGMNRAAAESVRAWAEQAENAKK